MAITTLQREQRQSAIGSSDAAAILGFSPWKTGADVRLEKLGAIAADAPGELAEIGTALEPAIADLAAKRLGLRLVKPTGTYRHQSGCMAANLDRQVDRAARGQPLVECKDSGLDDDWGEPGTDQMPAYVKIQVCHQMLCSDAREAHVARLGRGWVRGLFMYRLDAAEPGVARLMSEMEEFIPRWWEKFVVNAEPLPESAPPPSMESLKRLRRVPQSVVAIPSALFTDAAAKRQARLDAEKAEKEANARLLAALEMPGAERHAEAGECPEGVVTYFEQRRAEHVVKESTFRVMRFKPAK